MSGRDGSEGDWASSPRLVRDGLEGLARRLGAPSAASLGAVFERWEEAVGPTIAAHARPRALNDGVLIVAVDQPAWATQLRYMANDVRAKLDTMAGGGVIGRIEIRMEAER